jgi:methionine sulfoxide reductase heme-binding subunit
MTARATGGWPLVGWCAAGVAGMVAVLLGVAGTDEDGLRLVIRATARTSAVLFVLAFTASAARRRWPSRATRWLLENRRYVGVSFGVSHMAHLLAILALAGWSLREFFVRAGPVAGILGGLGYVVLAALLATSFDTTAAWLGPRRWQRLHRAGVWYLWFIFAATFAPATARSPLLYGTFTALLAVAAALRLAPTPRR